MLSGPFKRRPFFWQLRGEKYDGGGSRDQEDAEQCVSVCVVQWEKENRNSQWEQSNKENNSSSYFYISYLNICLYNG